MSNINTTDSPVIAEIVAGGTHTQEGVPLGLINYMIHNRGQFDMPLSRVESKAGLMWWKGELPLTKKRLFVWNEVFDLLALRQQVMDDQVRLT